jgi:hypothetical protein
MNLFLSQRTLDPPVDKSRGSSSFFSQGALDPPVFAAALIPKPLETDCEEQTMTDQPDEPGTRRELLLDLRQRLLEAFHDDKRTQPRDLSSLAIRIREIDDELRAMDDELDEMRVAAATPDEPFDPDAL